MPKLMSTMEAPTPAAVGSGFIPRRAPGTEATHLGADYILLDPSGTKLRGLNRTGARVWELADGARSVAEIARMLSEESKAPLARVEADVLGFVTLLSSKRLFLAGDTGGPP